jgi:hypothetical protein
MGRILPQVDGACILAGMSTILEKVKERRLASLADLRSEKFIFNGKLSDVKWNVKQLQQFREELNAIEEMLQELGWITGSSIIVDKPVLNVPSDLRIKWRLSDPLINFSGYNNRLRALQILSFPASADILQD